ncbi:MAG: PEGA domain-containing protein [Candidatus Omnitrophica bacterium]|nr:PEGA domain-containing protein [Candidatus Omnitrophota bacterium]
MTGGSGSCRLRHPSVLAPPQPLARRSLRALGALAPASPAAQLALLAVACLLATGCVKRTLVIRSEPPGARVFLNDQRAGTTPYTKEFLWYGWYRVTLIKDGYDRLDDRALIKAPPHQWIPLDFIAELLPVKFEDTHELSYELVASQPIPEPAPPADLEAPHAESR